MSENNLDKHHQSASKAEKNASGELLRYLCFNLGQEEFAIPLLAVREVIGPTEMTPIPQVPKHFLGMINLRGLVITVIDLCTKLNIKAEKTDEQSFIILDLDGLVLGVRVDSVNSVQALEPKEIKPTPHLENQTASAWIEGVFEKNKKLVLMIDIHRVLSVQDKSIVAQRAA